MRGTTPAPMVPEMPTSDETRPRTRVLRPDGGECVREENAEAPLVPDVS